MHLLILRRSKMHALGIVQMYILCIHARMLNMCVSLHFVHALSE